MRNKIIILISLAALSLQCNGGCSGNKTPDTDSATLEETTTPAAEITKENAQVEAEKLIKELKNM
ncbi:MAG: hypothetical protein ABUK01_08395 [Leptospirales bacterium]